MKERLGVWGAGKEKEIERKKFRPKEAGRMRKLHFLILFLFLVFPALAVAGIPREQGRSQPLASKENEVERKMSFAS